MKLNNTHKPHKQLLQGLLKASSIAALLIISSQSIAGGVVVVHPDNANAIDAKTVQRIFLGKASSFPSGDKAVAVDLPVSESAHKSFSENVLKKKQSQLKSYWAKLVFTGKGTPLKQLNSAAEVIEAIQSNPNTIGYIDESAVTDQVKVALTF